MSTPECSEVGILGHLDGTQHSTLLLYLVGALTDVVGYLDMDHVRLEKENNIFCS